MKMNSKTLDFILIVSAAFFVIADIVLSLSLSLVLPKYVTNYGYYPASLGKVDLKEATDWCPCIYKIHRNMIKFINFRKYEKKYSGTLRRLDAAGTNDEIPEEFPEKKLASYPFLAAVNILGTNNSTKPKFTCNAIFQEKGTVYLKPSCLQSKWKKLTTIRLNSPYSLKDGNVYRYISSFPSLTSGIHRYLHKMIVTPKWTRQTLPKIDFQFSEKWDYAQSVGWNTKFPEQPIEVETWTTRDVPKDIGRVCDSYSDKTSLFYLTNCTKLLWSNLTDRGFCKKYKAVKISKDIPKKAKCPK